MLELSPYDEDSNIKCSLTDLIFTNTKIIDKSKHWSLILFQEFVAINRLKRSLNHAPKDLLIFKDRLQSHLRMCGLCLHFLF